MKRRHFLKLATMGSLSALFPLKLTADDERKRVIVIGTGCGGAGVAALAAYYGHETLIFEKNESIGGRTATFQMEDPEGRGVFKLDHGHMLMRCNAGPHGDLLRMIKRRDLIPEFSYAMNWGIKGPINGKTAYFRPIPKRQPLVYKPFGLIFSILKYHIRARDCAKFIGFLLSCVALPKRRIKQFDQISFREFLLRYTDDDTLHSLFGGLFVVALGASPDDVSAGEALRILRYAAYDLIRVGYPVNGEGVQAIPNSFMTAAQEYGAQLVLDTPVEEIVIENNTVKGVMVEGKMIEADMVISNVGLGETVSKLVGEDKFEPSYANRIKNLKYGYGGLSLKYALDTKITDYHLLAEIPANFLKMTEKMNDGILPDRLPWMGMVTSNIDPSLAPEGRQSLCVISGGAPMEPGLIDWEEWMDKVKQQVRDLLPNIDEHTLFVDEMSPEDIAEYGGGLMGDAIGVAQSVDQVGDLRPSPVSPINGLFYVGADVGRDNVATDLASESVIALEPYLRTNQV